MLAYTTSGILKKIMRTLHTQRFIIGFFALILFLGLGFFVYSRNYEVSFSNLSSAGRARSIFDNPAWREEITRFYTEAQKEGRAFSLDTLNPKNPQNLTEQLATVFSKKMVTDPQFDIGKFSGREGVLSEDIIQNIDGDALRENPQVLGLVLTLPPEGDIKISRDNSKQAAERYLKTTEKILSKKYVSKKSMMYGSKTSVNEFEIVNYGISNNDVTDIQGLANFFEERAREMKLVNTPSELSLLHRKIIAYLSYNARIYTVIAGIKTDPVLSLAGLQKMKDLNQPMVELVNDIRAVKVKMKI